jgi:hypothetical protein
MRTSHLGICGSAGLVVALAGAAAILSPASAWSEAKPAARGPSSAPLRALSDADLTSSRQTGCTCSFDQNGRILMQAIGSELMLRTGVGRQVCRISEAQVDRFDGGKGQLACGGVRMSLRRTGKRTLSVESDSSSAPAVLTISQGARQTRLSGSWGCAC